MYSYVRANRDLITRHLKRQQLLVQVLYTRESGFDYAYRYVYLQVRRATSILDIKHSIALYTYYSISASRETYTCQKLPFLPQITLYSQIRYVILLCSHPGLSRRFSKLIYIFVRTTETARA